MQSREQKSGTLIAAARSLCDICLGILDLIYPPHCVVCRNADDGYLCQKCIDKIALIEPPLCNKCGKPSQESICDECRQHDYAFVCARSAAIFDGPLRDAIHSPFCSSVTDTRSLSMKSLFGKMSTTSAQRLVSLFSRSRGFVE